jgi:SMC interacting uncharacterized protein involved in chromosome segregation
MLVWMVDLVLAVEQFDEGHEDPLTQVDQADKMFFEYLTKAYDYWLEGAEDTGVIDNILLENFGIFED